MQYRKCEKIFLTSEKPQTLIKTAQVVTVMRGFVSRRRYSLGAGTAETAREIQMRLAMKYGMPTRPVCQLRHISPSC